MSTDERPAKRARFAETVKVQPYDKCLYDVSFHRPVSPAMAALEDAVERVRPTPPAPLAEDLDEVELLIEDFHPELELETKPFDGSPEVHKCVVGLLSLANVADECKEIAVYARLCLHDKLTGQQYNSRVLTVHSAIVDAVEELEANKDIHYAKGKLPLCPPRLAALKVVLGHLRTICTRRGLTIKKE